MELFGLVSKFIGHEKYVR